MEGRKLLLCDSDTSLPAHGCACILNLSASSIILLKNFSIQLITAWKLGSHNEADNGKQTDKRVVIYLCTHKNMDAARLKSFLKTASIANTVILSRYRKLIDSSRFFILDLLGDQLFSCRFIN